MSPTDPTCVERQSPDGARLSQLLRWLPFDYVLDHLLSLFVYWASCPITSVRLFANDALVSRILLLMNGVRPLAVASGWVCQLHRANQISQQMLASKDQLWLTRKSTLVSRSS